MFIFLCCCRSVGRLFRYYDVRFGCFFLFIVSFVLSLALCRLILLQHSRELNLFFKSHIYTNGYGVCVCARVCVFYMLVFSFVIMFMRFCNARRHTQTVVLCLILFHFRFNIPCVLFYLLGVFFFCFVLFLLCLCCCCVCIFFQFNSIHVVLTIFAHSHTHAYGT